MTSTNRPALLTTENDCGDERKPYRRPDWSGDWFNDPCSACRAGQAHSRGYHQQQDTIGRAERAATYTRWTQLDATVKAQLPMLQVVQTQLTELIASYSGGMNDRIYSEGQITIAQIIANLQAL